jgi:tetratricopeptide (TPR) repeat protein
MGRCYTALGQTRLADNALQKTLELRPDFADARLALGDLYLKEKDYPRAAAEYRTAAGQMENDPQAYASLGRVSTAAGDFKEAETCFEKALLIAPDDPWVLYHAGQLYKSMRDADKARVYFEKSLANAGTDEQLRSLLSDAFNSLKN